MTKFPKPFKGKPAGKGALIRRMPQRTTFKLSEIADSGLRTIARWSKRSEEEILDQFTKNCIAVFIQQQPGNEGTDLPPLGPQYWSAETWRKYVSIAQESVAIAQMSALNKRKTRLVSEHTLNLLDEIRHRSSVSGEMNISRDEALEAVVQYILRVIQDIRDQTLRNLQEAEQLRSEIWEFIENCSSKLSDLLDGTEVSNCAPFLADRVDEVLQVIEDERKFYESLSIPREEIQKPSMQGGTKNAE